MYQGFERLFVPEKGRVKYFPNRLQVSPLGPKKASTMSVLFLLLHYSLLTFPHPQNPLHINTFHNIKPKKSDSEQAFYACSESFYFTRRIRPGVCLVCTMNNKLIFIIKEEDISSSRTVCTETM